METATERSSNIPNFGEWVKQRRKACGLTQHTLALQIGYAVSTIRKIEAGVLRPSHQVAEQLADALNIEPDQRAHFLLAARSLLVHRNQQQPDAPNVVNEGGSPLRRPGIPVPSTPLLGRQQELEHLTMLLEDDTIRFLTLSGPGGIGKTRLALELARTTHDRFPDGVWFVPLSHLTDVDLLIPTIGNALGLLDAGSRSVHDRLFEYAQQAKTVIVLDNIEQIVAARDILAALLAHSLYLKIVCTSRIRLSVYGEYVFPVQPLSLPALTSISDEHIRVSIPALDLFVQRAQAIHPAFQATPANRATIAQICNRLGGLPLAIELAAARSAVLSLTETLERLQYPFELLTNGARTSPARHQTMRAAIDWSYHLLAAHEQRLFAVLSTFAGGYTLEAAEAVGSALGLYGSIVLNGLTALVDASFVHPNHEHPQGRFTILEILRDYGRERLSEIEDADEVYRQHAMYFLHFVQQAEPSLVGPEQVVWLDRVRMEHDNIRVALAWSLQSNEPEVALGLATAVGRFWWLHGHLNEGKRWLNTALARSDGVPDQLRAKAHYWEGILTIQQGTYAAAQVSLEEGLALYRNAQDESGIALALNALGVVANRQGDHHGAQARYEAALARYRALGDQERIATLLNNLGFTHVLLGNTATALIVLEESLRLSDQLGDVQGRAFALTNLGVAALQDGRLADATDNLAESLQLFWTLGDKRSCAECLEAVADLLLQRKQDAYIFVTLRAADMLREQIGAPRSQREQERYTRVVNATQRTKERGAQDAPDDWPSLTASLETIIRVLREGVDTVDGGSEGR